MRLSQNQRTKVFLIAMVNSVHTARWLQLHSNEALDITLFPSTPSRSVHPAIESLIASNQNLKVEIPRGMRLAAFPFGILDFFIDNRIRAAIIRLLVRRSSNGFDVIHAMELQHAGYLLERALHHLPPQNRIIASNWGSDIFWFQRFKKHRIRLVSLLDRLTHYSCECQRDLLLARNLGFQGSILSVQPNAGPIKNSELTLGSLSTIPSNRKRILLKGYTGFVGRADVALEACRLAANALRDFEIVVYSSDFKSRRLARKISRQTGLVIKSLKKHELSHEQMLDMFRSSRIYIGISESDGISTSLLDAISSGTFPIQSNTSCADEWIEDGISGFIVPFEDVETISRCLTRAATDDNLVNSAFHINIKTSQQRLSPEAMNSELLRFYEL